MKREDKTKRIVKLIKFLYENGPKKAEEILKEVYKYDEEKSNHRSVRRKWERDRTLLKEVGILNSKKGLYFVFAKKNLEIDLELWWAGKFYLRNEKLTESLNKLKIKVEKGGIIVAKIIPQILRLMGYEDNEENRKIICEWAKRKGLSIV